MTPMKALHACLETLEKIADENGPIESSSLMDWRRKVKLMAEKTHAHVQRSLKNNVSNGPCPGCLPALNPPPAPGESCCVCDYTNPETLKSKVEVKRRNRRPNPADGARKPPGYNPVA